MEKLKRDFLPPELFSLLNKTGIDGTIAVQARQCLAETEWLLELAQQYPFIKAVIGWVDLLSPQVHEQLQRFASNPALKGVRHVLQDEPDLHFMLRPDFLAGLGRLEDYNLLYEILIFPQHLPIAAQLVSKFPNQLFVLDHLAKPFIKDKKMQPWKTDICKLAGFPNVVCKISGMVTEADWHNWTPADFIPYMETVLSAFGTDRVMLGSDWPVCTLAAEYEQVIGIAEDYLQKLSPHEQKLIWQDNPSRVYALSL